MDFVFEVQLNLILDFDQRFVSGLEKECPGVFDDARFFSENWLNEQIKDALISMIVSNGVWKPK